MLKTGIKALIRDKEHLWSDRFLECYLSAF